MLLTKCIFFVLFFAFAISMHDYENEIYNRIVKLVTDYRDLYHLSHIIIARNNAAGDLLASTVFLRLLRYFSQQNVFSMITSIVEIPKDILHTNKPRGRPFFVIFILTMQDFHAFSKVTKVVNLNPYQMFILFKNDIEFCREPEGNPFNLVYDSRMLIKCGGLQNIREWYSLYPNKTEVFELLNWKSNVTGFTKLTNLSFLERRSSLNGLTLRVTLLENSKLEGDKIGFFGSVIKEIANYANFKIDLQPYESNAGSFNPETKKWNGVMEKLINKKTDIGVGEFTMTVERLEAVDFSDPVAISKTNFYLKEPQEYHLQWSMYYKAHGVRASYCLTLFFILSPIIVALTMMRTSNTSFYINVYDNYFQVWGIICNKSPTELPENSPTRIAYYSLFLLGFVMYSTYSAILVSYLAIFEPDLPFDSIEKFIAAKTHKITTLKNTSYIDSLKVSDNPLMQELNNFLLDEKEIPQSLTTALKQVCDDNSNIILYLDETVLRSKHSTPCKLIPFERDGLSNLAFAFVQDSRYVKLINYHLRRMRDVGILDIIEARSMRKPASPLIVYKSVNLWSTMPVFVILIIGTVLSISILILEIIFYCAYKNCK